LSKSTTTELEKKEIFASFGELVAPMEVCYALDVIWSASENGHGMATS